MAKDFLVAEGESIFQNLWETDTYMGRPTDYYNITLSLSKEAAKELESARVKVKTYQPTDDSGNPSGDPILQRKFQTRYSFPILNEDNSEFSGTDLPRGSKVRVKFTLGKENPELGVPTYLSAVKILEVAEEEESVTATDF